MYRSRKHNSSKCRLSFFCLFPAHLLSPGMAVCSFFDPIISPAREFRPPNFWSESLMNNWTIFLFSSQRLWIINVDLFEFCISERKSQGRRKGIYDEHAYLIGFFYSQIIILFGWMWSISIVVEEIDPSRKFFFQFFAVFFSKVT